MPSRQAIVTWLRRNGWALAWFNSNHEAYIRGDAAVNVWYRDNERNRDALHEVARAHGMDVRDVIEGMK